MDDLEEDEEDAELDHAHDTISSPEEPTVPRSLPSSPLRANRQEDTVRRRKRFSMPAVAIHTTPVTARPNVIGEGKSKRWSLVLGNLKNNGSDFAQGVAAGRLNELLGRQGGSKQDA